MIDTVRISGDYEISDEMLYVIPWTNNYAVNASDDNGFFGERFFYREKGQLLSVEYASETKKLSIETSIPRFLFGNNVQMIAGHEIEIFFHRLNDFLREKFYAYPRHDWTSCQVHRMDVCWNFQVGDLVADYIQAFGNIYLPRYTTRTYGGGETVEWSNKSKRMSFYDKKKEVRKRKRDEQVIEMARGILRFEVNLKGYDLKKVSPKKWAGELLSEEVAKHFLHSHLQKLGIDKQLTICNQLEVIGKLCKAYDYNKAQQLFGFIHFYQLLGREAIMEQLSASTYDRRMKDLNKVGLAPMFSTKELPPLDLSFIENLNLS